MTKIWPASPRLLSDKGQVFCEHFFFFLVINRETALKTYLKRESVKKIIAHLEYQQNYGSMSLFFFRLHEIVKSKIFKLTFYRITPPIEVETYSNDVYDVKWDTTTLKSMSGWDIPNWTTFQIYVFAFTKWRFSSKFYCYLKSKNGLKSKSEWK